MFSTRFSARAAAAVVMGLSATGALAPAAEASVFTAQPVIDQNFVMVAAPIGSSARSQLNIYEQVSQKRPCFQEHAGSPTVVNPLLSEFDFSGICSRYLDSNGYSVRIGNEDKGTSYRLSVVKEAGDVKLMAISSSGREGAASYVVARAGGDGAGFLKLSFEPGWELRRRQYGNRGLGHLYLYRQSADQAVASAGVN